MAKVNPIQLQKYLGGLDYPVDKQDIIERAQAHGADKNVMGILQKLPTRDYYAPTDISREIGKLE